jgi:hypothetical protein
MWILLRLFGHKREEVKGDWRKLHSYELRNLNSLPENIKSIKSKCM